MSHMCLTLGSLYRESGVLSARKLTGVCTRPPGVLPPANTAFDHVVHLSIVCVKQTNTETALNTIGYRFRVFVCLK